MGVNKYSLSKKVSSKKVSSKKVSSKKVSSKKVSDFLKKYCVTIEFIGIVIIIAICVYAYFKYDKKKKINVSFDFLNDDKPKKKKRKKTVWKTQEKCRSIFQKLYGKKFLSVRPSFLKNPTTGQNLELDGYCKSLNLAFEYDGEQHSKYNPHFHKGGPNEFIYQVAKDDYKTKKCKLEGVDLIRIPHYIHPENLEEYIIRELKKINRLNKND